MTKYGLIAAIALSILGALYQAVPYVLEEVQVYGEMKSDIKHLNAALEQCVNDND